MCWRMKIWLKLRDKNLERFYINLTNRQGHLSHIDILPLKWDIFKNKMKDVKYTQWK